VAVLANQHAVAVLLSRWGGTDMANAGGGALLDAVRIGDTVTVRIMLDSKVGDSRIAFLYVY
jgi:hypothetical protein